MAETVTERRLAQLRSDYDAATRQGNRAVTAREIRAANEALDRASTAWRAAYWAEPEHTERVATQQADLDAFWASHERAEA